MKKTILSITCNLVVLIFLFSFFSTANAERKTYVGVGEYVMRDFETPDIAKQRAKARAEQNAVEQAGVYVESYTKTENSIVVKDEITAITIGILHVMDTKYSFTPLQEQSGSTIVKATIKAYVDSKQMDEWMKQNIQQKLQYTQQLKELLQENEKLEKENIALKKRMDDAKTAEEIEKVKKEIEQNDKKFLSKEKIKEGIKLTKDKDYNSAVTCLTEAVNLAPSDYGAYYFRGLAYDEMGKHQEALNDYLKAIKLEPSFPVPYYFRSKTYMKLKQYPEAIADINKFLSMKITGILFYNNKHILADALCDRAQAYFHTKQYNLMLKDADKAIELDPNKMMAYYWRAFGEKRKNDYAGAIHDMSKVIEIASATTPSYLPVAYRLRAYIYEDMGEKQKAQADIEIAEKLIERIKTAIHR